MKKLIPMTVVLLLSLILSACTPEANVGERPDEAANANLETDGTSPSPEHVFSIKGELPDIGEFTGKKTGGRFYEEYTPDFIPSDKYGEIVPYIGGHKIFSTPDSDWKMEQGYCSYGFCTPDGKIVMDAAYENNYIRYNESDDGFGYYTLSRDIEQVEDAPGEFYSNETLIIPRSGAWCLRLARGSWVSGVGNGMIAVSVYGDDVRTMLYNYEGDLLKELPNIDTVSLAGGELMKISGTVGDEHFYWFMNSYGEKQFGPYKYAGDFNEYGITYVHDTNNENYLMDVNGKRLTEGNYDSFMTYVSNDGKTQIFSARYSAGTQSADIFGAQGEYIGKTDGTSYTSFRFPENGEIIYYYNSAITSSKLKFKRLSDGTDFVSVENGEFPTEHSGNDNVYVYINELDGSGLLFDGNGETIAKLPEISSFADMSDNGKFFTYSTGNIDYMSDEVSDTRKVHFYDVEKGEVVCTLDKSGYASFIGKNDRYITATVYEEEGPVFAGLGKNYLFDTETGEMLFDGVAEIVHMTIDGKDYFNVCAKNTCTLYDGEMNVIMRHYAE